jgi:hypothetical protein
MPFGGVQRFPEGFRTAVISTANSFRKSKKTLILFLRGEIILVKKIEIN